MGLAASQARFLAITSRKMNCEFQSMQIAQQKLSVTRDLQKAAQDYQNNLTATKLVWEDMDENTYDLTYDMMMTPTAINQYDPYLVTDSRGKIVLTKSMFNAALAAGIINENGDPVVSAKHPSQDGRNEFINALGANGGISGTNANIVLNNTRLGYTNSGIGGEIYDKSIANGLNTYTFINYMKNAKDENGNLAYNMTLESLFASSTNPEGLVTTTSLDNTVPQYVITKNGSALTADELKNLNLGEILSGRYELSAKQGVGADLATEGKKILDEMAKVLGLGADPNDFKGLNVDDEAKAALDKAMEFTEADCLQKTQGVGNGILTNVANKSHNYNCITSGSNFASISLTNMLKSYLTNFAIMLDGWGETPFVIKDKVSESVYTTNDLNYYFVCKNEGAMTNQEDLVTDFYNMLYNQICMNGACTDKTKTELAITDSNYLAHALKNGQLFISSLNNDGYFYQGPYTLNGHVAEVPDENAIAQAELEYNVTKIKLNYKEETLELQMKNLDMEISALTTEFDTVKNLISKGVEKVFTMFSN